MERHDKNCISNLRNFVAYLWKIRNLINIVENIENLLIAYCRALSVATI
jgi:hypothetical protein